MKILKVNELAGLTYKSVMDKVRGKGDPRSFRLYSDAKKMRSNFYSKEPLKILLKGKSEPIDIKIDDIYYNDNNLLLTTIKNNKQQSLKFDIKSNELTYEGSEPKTTAYVDRRSAKVICKILKDYGVEIRPQDIPHL